MSKLPSKKQLEFLNWEFGVFFHFGIRTFNEGHKDWDMKPMELESFNPTASGAGNKYFTPYTHSVVRRIDECALMKTEE